MTADMEVAAQDVIETAEVLKELEQQEQAIHLLLYYARALTRESTPDQIYLAFVYAIKMVRPCEEVATMLKNALNNIYNTESPWKGFF